MEPCRTGRTSRRTFLQALALGSLPGILASCTRPRSASRASAPSTPTAELGSADLISSPEQALDVFDLEAAARARLPSAHFGYLASGTDGDRTVQANRDAFDRWFLRPRRLVDVTSVDTSVELLGVRWPTPIVLAPVGSQRAFHPEGELATARAARAANCLQILSTVTSTSVEEVAAARETPLWYQLYTTTRWEIAETIVRRVAAAGVAAIVVTVDYPAAPNRETQFRAARRDSRDCTQCHTGATGDLRRKPMYAGTDLTAEQFRASNLTWKVIERLQKLTPTPILIKGILTAEDAADCVRYGAAGVIVSNHGGRSVETGRASLSCLPEVVAAVSKRVPVLVDGGFRRGTDVFKALALGADAICVGRPYVWGLAAFGQPGVERALALLHAELASVMRLTGTTSLKDVTVTKIGAV